MHVKSEAYRSPLGNIFRQHAPAWSALHDMHGGLRARQLEVAMSTRRHISAKSCSNGTEKYSILMHWYFRHRIPAEGS